MNSDSSEEEQVTENDQQQNEVKGTAKGKSCKGYLYYSSTLKSKARNPRCLGIPRSLPQVPNYVVGQSQVEASKEGRNLLDFYYACLGYSVYMTEKDSSADKQGAKTELPVCVGLELLVDRRVAAAAETSSPAQIHDREESRELPQARTHKPTHTTTGDDFLNRFTRNANLVASGVARNMRRVGNYIKESIDDILYPYRRRPK